MLVTLSVWNISGVAYWQSWSCVGALPSNIHRDTCLSLQCDCLTKSSSTRVFSHLSLHVLFITDITLAVNNDDGSNWEWSCDVLVCVKYAIWLVLSSTYHFFDGWFTAVCRPRSARKRTTYDAVVKFDTYRNLQRHHTVLAAIALLSCLIFSCFATVTKLFCS